MACLPRAQSQEPQPRMRELGPYPQVRELGLPRGQRLLGVFLPHSARTQGEGLRTHWTRRKIALGS
jgi:hypothetical protein